MESTASDSLEFSRSNLVQLETEVTKTNRKVLRRFYEPLLLLEALGRVRGAPIKPVDTIDSTGDNFPKLRRAFMDGIAYLCAFQRVSDHVTAAALEKTPEGLVVWLGANGGVHPETMNFAEELLQDVHRIANEDNGEKRFRLADEILPVLLPRVIAFNRPRIEKYVANILSVDLKLCLETIRQASHPGSEDKSPAEQLCEWLERTFVVEDAAVVLRSDIYVLVLDCYIQRKRLLFEPLKFFSGQGQSRASDFERVYMVLCKLGKHITFTRKVLEVAIYLPHDLREGIRVEALPSSPLRNLPLSPKEGTIESILGRAYSSPDERERFLTRLRSLWDENQISAILERERPSKTTVHAELLVADHFYRNNLQFLDNGDKYIGCSKPACYLCHAYLMLHPARFAVPASHQKLYTSWRCPDVHESDPHAYRLFRVQEKMWLDLINWVKRDLDQEVNSRTARSPTLPDSTAGVTSEDHMPLAAFTALSMDSLLQAHAEDVSITQQAPSVTESDDEDGGVLLT